MNAPRRLPSVLPPRDRTEPRSPRSIVNRWWGPTAALLVILAWAVSPVAGFRASLFILTILGFGALCIGFTQPAYGLLGITILCVIDAPARVYLLTGGLLRWNTFNYWLLAVMVLYLPFLIRLRDRHTITLVSFVAVLVLDLIISSERAEGVQHILGILVTLGLVVYFVRAGTDRRMWFWVGTVAGLIGALGGLMWFLQRTSLPGINENAWATFPATAMFAICLAFPSAASLRRGQPTLMTLATINLAWIFLSGSRGNLLIGVCCMILLLLSMRGLRQRTTAILCASLLAIAAAAHFSALQDRAMFRIVKLFTTSQPLAGDYSLSSRTSGRSDLAMGGWHIFLRHPFGVGTGGFKDAWQELDPSVFNQFADVGTYGRGEKREAHSGWVKTLAEAGVPGIVLLASYVFSFALAGLQSRTRMLRRLGILTSVTLAAALLSSEFQGKALWFLAAGTTVFLHRASLTAALYVNRRPAPRATPVRDSRVPTAASVRT